MATKIVTKNSSTASAVPTASDLVQGELAVNVADKRLFTEDNAGAIVELGTNPSTLTVTGEITANGGIALGDNDKATFGASDDLEIYHDGTNNRLTFVSANTYIQTDGTIHFTDIGNSEKHFTINDNGAVDLYYDNSKKLATTSTGIDVTGTATMDGLTVGDTSVGQSLVQMLANPTNGANTIHFGDSTSGAASYVGYINYAHDSNSMQFAAGGSERMRIDSSGNVGIGTSSPAKTLTVGNTDATSWISSGGSNVHLTMSPNGSAGAFIVRTGGTNGDPSTTTERMRIDASGNVGIGKTPDTNFGGYVLQLNGGSQTFMSFGNSTAGTTLSDGLVIGCDSNGADIYQREAQPLRFHTSNTERMRIDSSGNVGIGTTSPSAPLHVSGSDSTVPIKIDNTGTGGDTWRIWSTNDAASDGGGKLGFYNEDTATRAMTLDASGNLLVGKTSADNTTAGTRIHPLGYASFTIANDYPIIANRLSSDGPVAVFRKDGTTVGSIGALGANAYINSQGGTLKISTAGTERYNFDLDQIYPSVDNDTNLGLSNYRFKDLYLSGGAYLGGTGAANKLDDYEEGTFTAALTADTGTITLSNGLMRYTKIGRVVTVSGLIICSAISSPTGDISLTGLPFVVNNNTDGVYSGLSTGSIHIQGLASTITGNPQLNIPNNGTIIDIDGFNGTTRTSIAANISATTQIRICATYTT